jgi:hypothetical protein
MKQKNDLPYIHVGISLEQKEFSVLPKLFIVKTIKTIKNKNIEYKWISLNKSPIIFECEIISGENYSHQNDFHVGIHVEDAVNQRKEHQKIIKDHRLNNFVNMGELNMGDTFLNYFININNTISFEIIEYYKKFSAYE